MSPAGFNLDTASDWPWIVTYRYWINGPWGMTHSELTVNAPVVQGDPVATAKLGELLYQLTIATAMSSAMQCGEFYWKAWAAGSFGVGLIEGQQNGSLAGAPSAREDSGCLVLHSGHSDRLATKRIIIPGFPAHYTDDGLVTSEGLHVLEGLGHRMAMALLDATFFMPMGLMNRYTASDTDHLPGVPADTFRGGRYIYVMQHTARAPDFSPFF